MECKRQSEKDFVILVTGMTFESRIANYFGKNFISVVSGGSPHQLELKIVELIKQGAKAVISYGVAGALRENLKSGDIIIGSSVVDKEITFVLDKHWSSYLLKRLSGSVLERVLGVEKPVTDPFQKILLGSQSGAAIVDMESQIAARTAKSHGLPCAVIRVVLDDVYREIPEAARCAIKKNGKINTLALFFSILRSPKLVIGLISLTLDMARAVWSLLCCNRLLGKGFGFFDL